MKINIPFLKSRRDLFTIGIIIVLALSVVATQAAVNNDRTEYEKIITEASRINSNYSSMIINLSTALSNHITSMNTLNQTISNLQGQVSNLQDQLTIVNTNKDLLQEQVNNHQNLSKNITKQFNLAFNLYDLAQTNNSFGTYWFNDAKTIFYAASNGTLGQYSEVKNGSIKSKPFFEHAYTYYENSKPYYNKILNYTTADNKTLQLAHLYLNLTNTYCNILSFMKEASSHLTNASDFYYQAAGTNDTLWYEGYNETLAMNLCLNSTLPLKTTRDLILSQINAKIDSM